MPRWSALTRVMRTSRARRIGRQEAEELLRGISTSADREELLRLLALASAPARADELSGAQQALAAFGNGPAPTRVPPARRRTRGNFASAEMMLE